MNFLSKIFNLPSKIWIKVFSAGLFILFFTSYLSIFAQSNPFNPGETLDPDCLPGEENCIVNIQESASSIQSKLGPASSTTSGYLSSTDWNSFNSKQPAGNYLTSFTETDPSIYSWAKASVKPSYNYSEIGNTPTALSQFTNDLGNYGGFVTGTPWTSVGYLTSFTETDPSIYSWAKASVKPSYNYSEIGNTPTALSQFTNDLGNYGGFVTGTPWTSVGYLTSFTETDPTFSTWLGTNPLSSYLTSASMSSYVPFVGATSNLNLGTNTITSGAITTSGNMSITGDIIPSSNNTYSLGSPTKVWKDIYVGPGSIYVNGQKVLQTDISESVVVSADPAQNLILKTTSGGNIELNPAVGGGQILLKSNVTLTAGKSFRTSDLSPVSFSDGINGGNISLSSNTISSSNLNGGIEIAPNGVGNTYITKGNLGIGTTSPSYNLDIFKAGTGVTGALRVLSGDGASSSNKSQLILSHMTGGGLTYTSTISAGYNGSVYGLSLDTDGATKPILLQSVSGGNVGIGTTNPGYKLDVFGGSTTDGVRSSAGYDINLVTAPIAPTYTLSSGGSVDTGNHSYFVTYTTAVGETNAGTILTATVTAGNNTVNLTIPVSSDTRVTGRKIYRTKIGETDDREYLLATIANNTATTYTDTTADASLTGSTYQYYRVNSTSKYITVGGVQSTIIDKNLVALGKNAGEKLLGSYAPIRTVLIGDGAGKNITTGTANIIVGQTGASITTGSGNTLLGDLSSLSLTTGGYNTAIGAQALRFVNTTSQNTAIGSGAGTYLNDGSTQNTGPSNSLYVGYNARGYDASETNSIVIGYNALGLGSNTVVLGNNSITTTALKGNVGIGSTAPARKVQIQSDTDASLYLRRNTTTAGDYSEILGAVSTSDVYNTAIRTYRDGRLGFFTNNVTGAAYSDLTESMTILKDGSVGIGTTNPAGKLGILASDTTVKPFLSVRANAAPAYGIDFDLEQLASGYMALYSNRNGSRVLGLTQSYAASRQGYVGIGTTNPLDKLQVDASNGTGITISRPTFSDNEKSVLSFEYNSGASFSASIEALKRTGGHSDLNFYTGTAAAKNASPTMTLQNTGNVGIGTTTPTYKLDVRGTAQADGIRSAMGYDIYQVPDPTAPTGVVSAGGSVDDGDHWYGITYVTATGETHVTYSAAQITTTTGNNTVTLTIPVSTDPRVTSRKIYRTKAGEAQYRERFLATVANNTDVTYVDTIADSALGATEGIVYFSPNTTSKNITVNGVKSLTLDDKATNIGKSAGASLTTGGRNVLVGQYAGYGLTTASDSTFVGHYAGGIGTVTGSRNTYIGSYSGKLNTSGSYNVGVGPYTLTTNLGGNYNAAIGDGSLQGNTSGSYNTGLGTSSLQGNTTGSSNTAIGNSSLISNISGSGNSSIGSNAGRYIADGSTSRTTGNNGLYLGYGTRASADGTDNEIVIGYNAIGLGSNTATYGNTSMLKHIFSAGNVGIGTTTPATKLQVSATDLTAGFLANLATGSTSGRAFAVGAIGETYDRTIFYSNGFIGFGPGSATRDVFIGRSALNTLQIGSNYNGSGTGNLVVNGNIGIGATSPRTKLEIKSNSGTTLPSGQMDLIIDNYNGGTPTDSGIVLAGSSLANGYGVYSKILQTSVNGSYGSLQFQSRASDLSANFVTRMSIDAQNGNVGIGTTTPSYTLDVGNSSVSGIVAQFTNSTGYCTINPTTTSLSCSSDISLKKNIYTLDNKQFILNTLPTVDNQSTLDKILTLTPVTYNWNTENDTDIKHIGFIAQDMEQVFPDLVTTDSTTNLKSISYGNLTPYLVKAIQEMSLKITTISNIDTPNIWRDSIIAWLSNSANGIKDFISNKIHAKDEICIGEGSEEVCITPDQLRKIKESIIPIPTTNVPFVPKSNDPIVNETDPTPVTDLPVTNQEGAEQMPPVNNQEVTDQIPSTNNQDVAEPTPEVVNENTPDLPTDAPSA